VTGLPIKDDRPGSLRTESIELPQGKGAARAARAAVDTLTRDLGELYHDVRLLVSELVTATACGMNEAVGLRLEISISRATVKVVVRYEDTGGIASGLGPPVVGQWTHMLLDALTSAWGTGDDGDACLWFEMARR
jgi:hypothetical protein